MAKHLYDESRYFRRQWQYATAVGDHAFILSAEHGLVAPNEILHPYNTSMSDVQAGDTQYDDAGDWATQVADDFCPVLRESDVVIFTAGSDYADPLVPVIEHRTRADVLEPFRGQGIGTRQQNMQDRAREASSASLADF